MKKETKKFWESLKLKNEALFNEFKFAIVGEVVKGNDLVIGYNEETNDFVYSFYQKADRMRKLVHKCKAKWLKKLLRKWFPDQVVYVPRFVTIAYPAMSGILDVFLSQKNLLIDIQFNAKEGVYSYSLAWYKNKMPSRRAYVTHNMDYVSVHQSAVKNAWALFYGKTEM